VKELGHILLYVKDSDASRRFLSRRSWVERDDAWTCFALYFTFMLRWLGSGEPTPEKAATTIAPDNRTASPMRSDSICLFPLLIFG
jgi:hypothetical protein